MQVPPSKCCPPQQIDAPQKVDTPQQGDVPQQVPDPVVNDSSLPPEPIPLKDVSPTDPTAPPEPQQLPSSPVTQTASQLPNWTVWQQRLMNLGVADSDITRIGNEVDANKIGELYAQLVEQLGPPNPKQGPGDVPTPADPTAPSPGPGQGSEPGPGPGKPGMPDDPSDPGKLPTPPTSPTSPTDPGQSPGGWSQAWEARFRQLGMPDSIIALYKDSGASDAGLEAAFNFALTRIEDLTARGWVDKLSSNGATPEQIWEIALAPKPLSDDELDKIVAQLKKGNRSGFERALQTLVTFTPGGELAQFVAGKKFVSGQEIDRSNPLNIGFAALSGLALFTSIRGVGNIAKGWAARGGGYAELAKAGLSTQGQSVSDAALGASQTWGLKQKLTSLIPGTTLHREVVGLGHAEAAAKAFNGGGAAKLMQDADGALQVSTLGQMFDDIKTGTTRVRGSAIAYLGPFKGGIPMSRVNGKDGADIIRVASNLRIGDGRSQLASLLHVGGDKIVAQPGWLKHAPQIGEEIAKLSPVDQQLVGRYMAGNSVATLGIGSDGLRPSRALAKLANTPTPEWYARLASTTSGTFPGGSGGGAAAARGADTVGLDLSAFAAKVQAAGTPPVVGPVSPLSARPVSIDPFAAAGVPAGSSPIVTGVDHAGRGMHNGLYVATSMPTGGGASPVDPDAVAAAVRRLESIPRG
jgi:hypothetical protein